MFAAFPKPAFVDEASLWAAGSRWRLHHALIPHALCTASSELLLVAASYLRVLLVARYVRLAVALINRGQEP